MKLDLDYRVDYLRVVEVYHHVVAVCGLVFYGFSWTAAAVVFFSYFVCLMANEIALHRYFSHKSFQTTTFKDHILLVLSLFVYLGPPLWFVGTHRMHHAFADTEKDPHSPFFAGPFRIWMFYWNKYTIPRRFLRDMYKDKRQVFITRYYIPIVLLMDLCMFLISPFFFCFFILGVVIFYHALMAVNVFGHMDEKYKTYEDAPGSDIPLLAWISFGASNHNTHHKFEKSYHQNMNGKFDLMGIFIEKFFKK
jgi:stearoyl-CoA desaturase (delta-9 desaturase)